MRPCDAQAVQLLDTVFEQEQYTDPFWIKRQEKTIKIGLGCHVPCANGFCTTVGYGPFNKDGLDVLLTDLGDSFLVEVLSESGKTLFENLHEASEELLNQAKEIQNKAHDAMPIAFETENLKEKIDQNFKSDYWDEVSRSCLGCGVCTFLCPTCFCFDIVDEVQRQERVRNWDTCMFRIYSLEASGHNPRPSRVERTRRQATNAYWPIDRSDRMHRLWALRSYCPVGLDPCQTSAQSRKR